ncbi:MAG TPA: NADH-quinone oxidoreductase subunit C [Verrucomicrobiae bacterium]|nr:NADH-quinone oxidoreductase subunit C [Verrucomicrobiae bacterium]
MESIEKIKEVVSQAVTGAQIEIVNSTPAAQQPALLVDRDHFYAVAKFLRDDPRFQMDFCSCVTGVDYLPKDDKPGCIEVVYHLYSVALKQGPIVLKARAPREIDQCHVPSLTPLWRGCEFQEREAYDLYGVKFDGHSDLRRILMWEEFTDHPMRKDYVPPTDYEWEPTPHDDTLQRAAQTQGVVPPTALAELEKAKKK